MHHQATIGRIRRAQQCKERDIFGCKLFRRYVSETTYEGRHPNPLSGLKISVAAKSQIKSSSSGM